MAIDPTTTTTIKVGDLQSAAYSTTDLIPHEVGGYLKKGNLLDLANFIGEIIDVTGGVGFRAVEVNDGETLPATEDQEFILVGPGTFPNVGGGATITTTEPLNALVSNGTYWFIGVEIPITASGVWGTISGVLTDQTDLNDVLDAKADLVDGKVPNTQLPSYVDDIVEVANYAALPVVGETGKIYLTLDNNKTFRWSGSVYIEVAANNAIWGAITGTLSSQTDLQIALDTKALKTTTITINGTSYDLSANRIWTIPTHDAVTIGTANGLSLVGQSLSLGLASSINTGALSAENWATFNRKIGGSGNLNYIPKFTSSSAIGNSLLYDNGTNVFVGGSGSNDYRFNVVEGATLNGQQILMQNVSSSKEALHIVHIGTGNLIKGTKASAVEVFNVTNSGGAYFAGSVGIGNTNPTVAKLQVKGENGKYAGYLYNTSGVAGQTNGLIIEGGTNTLDYSLVVNSSAGLPYFQVRGDGKVGIGTTSPAAKLDVVSNGKVAAFGAVGSGGDNYISFVGSSNTFDVGVTDGSFGIADSGVAYRFKISQSGNVYVSTLGTGLLYSNAGTLTSTNPSDSRLKDDITDLQYGLNEILQLRPVSYNWKNDNINQGKQFGFIAQEVQEVMPELVKEFETEEGERLGLDKEGIYAALVNAIKELKAEIEILKNK